MPDSTGIEEQTMRFTSSSQGDEFVREHITAVIDELIRSGISDFTLIIIGSFGRGEGTIVSDKKGSHAVVNDYDFLLYAKDGFGFFARQKLKKIGKQLQQKLNLWHLDLIPISHQKLTVADPGMLLFDAKFGGQVVHGDTNILSLIKARQGDKIPDYEVLNLLINRQVTLFEAHPLLFQDYSRKFKARQLSKVWYALADALLNEQGAYTTKYSDKEQALQNLPPSPKSGALLERREFASLARKFRVKEDEVTDRLLQVIWDDLTVELIDQIKRLTDRVAGAHIKTDRDVVLFWRGGKKHAPSAMNSFLRTINCTLLGKRKKTDVEKDLFRCLCESREQHVLKSNTPETLIADWYGAK